MISNAERTADSLLNPAHLAKSMVELASKLPLLCRVSPTGLTRDEVSLSLQGRVTHNSQKNLDYRVQSNPNAPGQKPEPSHRSNFFYGDSLF